MIRVFLLVASLLALTVVSGSRLPSTHGKDAVASAIVGNSDKPTVESLPPSDLTKPANDRPVQTEIHAQGTDDVEVIEVNGQKITVRKSPPPYEHLIKTADDRLVEAGTAVPGFGGFFLDPEDGSIVHVYMLDPSQKAGAEQAVKIALGPLFPQIREVRVVQGKYSMSELAKWYEPISLFWVPGRVYTDLTEQSNRITVAVENADARELVLREVHRLGIPTEAVSVTITGPIRFSAHETLQSRVRPIRGGLKVSRSGQECTMTFVTVKQGVLGFVIPTHCSSNWGGVDGDVWYQPTVDANNRVGVETDDEPFFQGGNCPPGRFCRYSDSAFVSIDSGVQSDQGFIARTTGIGSITIDDVKPRFRIKEEGIGLAAGNTIDKIAMASGWRSGKVTVSCVNGDLAGTIATFLCQDLTDVTQIGGDSGGSVFRITNTPVEGDVVIEALAWGKQEGTFNAIVSELGFIYLELGPQETWNTCAPEFGC